MSPRRHPRSCANNSDHNRRFRDPIPDRNSRAWLVQPGFRPKCMRNSPQRYRARRVRISREWKAAEAAYGRPPQQNWERARTYAWSACLRNSLSFAWLGALERVRPSGTLTAYRRPIAMWKLRRLPIVGSAARALARSAFLALLSGTGRGQETEEETEPQRHF